jgi:hypothetical protein
MQRVRMLQDVPGSLDGVSHQIFRKGQEYTMNDEMVRGLIQEGWIELVLETKPEPAELETKPLTDIEPPRKRGRPRVNR